MSLNNNNKTVVDFKTIVTKFNRSDKKKIFKLIENIIESRLIFRNAEIEILYIEYVEGNFNITDDLTILNNDDILDLSKKYDFENKIKILDGKLYFKKSKRGGRIGRNGVKYQNERNPYRVNPE